MPIVKQIFSINVYKANRAPLIPVLRKNMCISDAPLVDIYIGGHAFNLLNATVSAAACRDLYRKLICEDIDPKLTDDCYYANLIMFAAVESISTCETDSDCAGIRSKYMVAPLWCEWTLQISKHVCQTPFNERLLNACELDEKRSTHIRGACVFTNAFCAFVVENVRYLAPLSGTLLFFVSFAVIYMTH